jgi:hypothetical protein
VTDYLHEDLHALESLGYLRYRTMVISIATMTLVLINVSQLAVRVPPGYAVGSEGLHWATLEI